MLRTRSRLAMAVVAVLVVLAASIAGLAVDHRPASLHLFLDGTGALVGTEHLPLRRTEHYELAISTGDDEPLSYHSLSPVVTINSAGATFGVELCTPRSGQIDIGGAVPDLGVVCSAVAPFRAGSYRLTTIDNARSGDRVVFLTVTAHHPGDLQICGTRVTYSRGSRRGAQTTGFEIDAHSP